MNSNNLFSVDDWLALTLEDEALSSGQDSYDFSRCDVSERAGRKTALYEVTDLDLGFGFGGHDITPGKCASAPYFPQIAVWLRGTRRQLSDSGAAVLSDPKHRPHYYARAGLGISDLAFKDSQIAALSFCVSR